MRGTLSTRVRATAVAAALFGVTSGATRAAQPSGYTFKPVAFLGDAMPAGGQFTTYFQQGPLNGRGDLVFDTPTALVNGAPQEAIFLSSGGQIIPIVRNGQPAPGGGTFDALEFGQMGLNDAGDVALAFSLVPAPTPLGLNVGVYRWSHTTQALAPVVIPKVTPAPGGGTFVGTNFNVSLNNLGQIGFSGITATEKGIHAPGEPYVGYAVGAYVADAQGTITAVASPGDSAPGGSAFDGAASPIVNDGGDVAFSAHRAGDPVGQQAAPQATAFGANTNVYLQHAASRQIEAIASVGDPLPGGGSLVAGGAIGLNNAGDVLFVNSLTPATVGGPAALYLHSATGTARIAGPGDGVPGGGKIALIGGSALNNRGDVLFNAALDTKDEGLYLYSRGALSLITRSGMDMPGVGTVYDLEQGSTIAPGLPALPAGAPNPLVSLNDQGQVAFVATLKDARIGLLIATPTP